jgi:hypothetical protein
MEWFTGRIRVSGLAEFRGDAILTHDEEKEPALRTPEAVERKAMKTLTCLFAALITAGSLFAQTDAPFSFKGNVLGMPLDKFKEANPQGPVRVTVGKKKQKITMKTPVCTDSMRDFPGDPRNLVDDEVVCNASPGESNPELREMQGIQLESVIYRFYKGFLYRIDINIQQNDFEGVRTAFTQKYGSPSASNRSLHWLRDHETLVLTEGPTSGPTVPTAVFLDSALSPKKPVDF